MEKLMFSNAGSDHLTSFLYEHIYINPRNISTFGKTILSFSCGQCTYLTTGYRLVLKI